MTGPSPVSRLYAGPLPRLFEHPHQIASARFMRRPICELTKLRNWHQSSFAKAIDHDQAVSALDSPYDIARVKVPNDDATAIQISQQIPDFFLQQAAVLALRCRRAD